MYITLLHFSMLLYSSHVQTVVRNVLFYTSYIPLSSVDTNAAIHTLSQHLLFLTHIEKEIHGVIR